MDLNFKKIKTKSGVDLWVLPMPHHESISAGVLVKSGTRDEKWPKEAGIAHALEHMHFQGTKDFPTSKDVSAYIEEVGGFLNAWTWKEMTFYYSKVPVIYANRAVHILSEQLNNSIFPKKKIKVEMNNIIQEIKRRNDNPQKRLSMISNKFIFANHPLSKDTLGIENSVLNFTKKDFLEFKNRYYNPSNYVFIVAGKITVSQALNMFNKYFPEKAKQKQVTNMQEKNLVTKNKTFLEKKGFEQLHMLISATGAPAKEHDSLLLDFFTYMLDGGSSFPLYQEVRDKLGLCYEVWAGYTKWSDIGRFDIYIGTDKNKYKDAVKSIGMVIESCKKDKKLLEKVKKLKIGQLALKFENTASIIDSAAQDIMFIGKPRDYDQIIKETKKVTIKDIEKVVNKYLSKEKLYTTILAPKDFKI